MLSRGEKKINKIYTRKILLSDGSLTTEVVLRFNDQEYYESAAVGLTVGLKENQYQRKAGSLVCSDLCDFLGIAEQEVFDSEVCRRYNYQISSALSLAYLKLLCANKNVNGHELYEFIGDNYSRSPSVPNIICNVVNGGKHARDKFSFCELMVIPRGSDTNENISLVSKLYQYLGKLIVDKNGGDGLSIGREGGYSPDLKSSEEAIILINQAINKLGNSKYYIAIDIAANNFARESRGSFIYLVDGKKYSTKSLLGYYQYLIKKYPLIKYLEDPFHESDLDGWRTLFNKFQDKILIVADDLTVSKKENIIKYNRCFNACILKINQSGTFSELLRSFNYCREKHYKTIISQRSGETDSNTIVHLARGLGSDFLKAGAPARERIVKYNELIRIS